MPVILVRVAHRAGKHPRAVGAFEEIRVGVVWSNGGVRVLVPTLGQRAAVQGLFLPCLSTVGGLADQDRAVCRMGRAGDEPDTAVPADAEPAGTVSPGNPLPALAVVRALEQPRRVAIDVNRPSGVALHLRHRVADVAFFGEQSHFAVDRDFTWDGTGVRQCFGGPWFRLTHEKVRYDP